MLNNTDMCFKLYRQAHPNINFDIDDKPKFSVYYKPSNKQKQYEMVYVGNGILPAGYVASKFM